MQKNLNTALGLIIVLSAGLSACKPKVEPAATVVVASAPDAVAAPETRVDPGSAVPAVPVSDGVQVVPPVTVSMMQDELGSKGRVTLPFAFEAGKAELHPDDKVALGQVASLMKANVAMKLTVEGHTDNSGDAQRDKTVSEQRAEAVVATLVASGIDKSRLNAVGLGATRQGAGTKNDRIELVKQEVI